MNSKKMLFIAFAIVALAQLFVPYQMIRKQAAIAATGTDFKFVIKKNQSGSSLRGKFIWLQFEENKIKVADKKELVENQIGYVSFTTDSLGFAKIKSVSTNKPVINSDWVKARVMINRKDTTLLQIIYPFDNYYIADTNINSIDSIIKNGLNDSLKINYLKIKIKENQFLIDDLMIDGVPFKKIVGKLKK